MKVFNKIKGWFVEEYEDDEDDEEKEEPLARKVEVPKPSFRDRLKNNRIEEDEEEDKQEEVMVEPVREERRIEPQVFEPQEDEEVEVPMEEEEEEFPSRSSRIPLVFEDDNLFSEVSEEVHEEEPKEEVYKKPLYQGKKESSYYDSKPHDYTKEYNDPPTSTKFRPSPIISPIYGILDKNYKKEEIVTRDDKLATKVNTDSSIDKVRKKAFGETKKEERVEPVKEKKVNVNNGKPGVSRVTIADADEYYNDLGLAYNEDYKDMSRSTVSKKKEPETKKDDDNLFDLIDSMYKKED